MSEIFEELFGKDVLKDEKKCDVLLGAVKKLHKNDSETTKYVIYNANTEYAQGIAHHNIYDMSDNGTYGLQADGTMTSYNMGNRLYYLESSVASFTRCASPPESVVAGCPSLIYPSPTSYSVLIRSRIFGIFSK